MGSVQKVRSRRLRRGSNSEARVATRKVYGFRSQEALAIARYHQLGDLPEPRETHNSAAEAHSLRVREQCGPPTASFRQKQWVRHLHLPLQPDLMHKPESMRLYGLSWSSCPVPGMRFPKNLVHDTTPKRHRALERIFQACEESFSVLQHPLRGSFAYPRHRTARSFTLQPPSLLV